MNADEIRNKRERFSERISGSMTCEPNEKDMFRYQGDMIRETAAQLAEINEHLAKIANPLMVVNGTEDTSDLRDQLAMSAMQGLFSNSSDEFWVQKPEAMSDTCKHSYEWADEMLKARKK